MYSSTGKNVSNDTGLPGYEGRVMFIDTKREKEIGLGTKWPFEPLGEGECLVAAGFLGDYNVKLNETIIFHFQINDILKALQHNYNILAHEKGWKRMAKVPNDDDVTTIAMNCTIGNYYYSNYGKLPDKVNNDQIILEWKYWLSHFSKFLDDRWTSNQDLMNYMQTPGM